MRPDMSKVIVERPRRGSRLRSAKFGVRLSPQLEPDEADPLPPRRPRENKSLNENLAPLERYLNKQVGRPWDKVYSEIRANLDGRKATQLHILQHLSGYVTTDCWTENGTLVGKGGFWGRAWPVEGLYVDPKTRLLCSAPRAKRDRGAKTVTRVRVSDLAHDELIDGIWYRFEYRRRDPDELLEVVRFHEDQPERNAKYSLVAPGDRRTIYYRDTPAASKLVLVSKRQRSRQEVKSPLAKSSASR